MPFAHVLKSDEFVVTAELGPPLDPEPELVRTAARALAPVVHAANVTDNQAATVKVTPLACAVWMMQEGLEPILQMTTRDRNVMALQSDLLGAWALGARNVLALSGDPLKVGPYRDLTKPVADFDSIGLIRLIAQLNSGHLLAGEELARATSFTIASAANPLVDTLDKMQQKLEAGVHCFQTNIVYDVDRFAAWVGPVVQAGITRRAPMIVGVTPPRSTRMLRHLHDHIPGVEVDDATFAAMEGLKGDDAKAAGVEIAVNVIRGLRAVPGVAGVHIMAPGWENEAVPRVVGAAGIAPARAA